MDLDFDQKEENNEVQGRIPKPELIQIKTFGPEFDQDSSSPG